MRDSFVVSVGIRPVIVSNGKSLGNISPVSNRETPT